MSIELAFWRAPNRRIYAVKKSKLREARLTLVTRWRASSRNVNEASEAAESAEQTVSAQKLDDVVKGIKNKRKSERFVPASLQRRENEGHTEMHRLPRACLRRHRHHDLLWQNLRQLPVRPAVHGDNRELRLPSVPNSFGRVPSPCRRLQLVQKHSFPFSRSRRHRRNRLGGSASTDGEVSAASAGAIC